jgi:hypothetical protein
LEVRSTLSTSRRFLEFLGTADPTWLRHGIWPAAHRLVRQHGPDAELEAARLQDLMLDRGDDERWRVWQRIKRAIEALRGSRRGKPN